MQEQNRPKIYGGMGARECMVNLTKLDKTWRHAVCILYTLYIDIHIRIHIQQCIFVQEQPKMTVYSHPGRWLLWVASLLQHAISRVATQLLHGPMPLNNMDATRRSLKVGHYQWTILGSRHIQLAQQKPWYEGLPSPRVATKLKKWYNLASDSQLWPRQL